MTPADIQFRVTALTKGLTVMKGVAVAASLAVAWGAGPLLAQAPAQPPKPAGQPPVAPPKPAPAPAAPAAPAPAPKPPAPFPQGAKVAYVYLQQIAALSTEGKAAQSKVTA